MTLEELTPWLFSRTTRGIRWGLERTERLLAGVGDPHRLFDSLLVGGTNGKGSVAALCDAGLRVRPGGRRVGLYTSPHLVSFSERIRIDGRPVEEGLLVEAAERLRPGIEETGASFFEATTAIAFLCFAEAGADFVVAEVGLGGRLDATNVLSPRASAVTNVALDHTEYLGDDLAGIAREKAGIFPPGAPALTAERDPALLRVLEDCAAAAGARFLALDALVEAEGVEVGVGGTAVELRSRRWGERRLRVPLAGPHQARNALLAAELLGLLPEEHRPTWDDVERGFAAVRWPGRMQVERVGSTTWLLDVAHNPAGVAALAATLDRLELPPPRVLVAAILADKDWREMLPPLLERVDAAILTTAPSAPDGRRWEPDAAARWLGGQGGVAPRVIPDLPAALRRAATLAPHGTVLVTGSFHTVGDAMRELGIAPG